VPARDAALAGALNGAAAVAWLRRCAALVHERRDWLTELDAAVGDGDHGINLDRGFRLLLRRLDAGDVSPVATGAVLVAAGRIILGSVGGASGALYGRALTRAGERTWGGADPVVDLAEGIAAAVDTVSALGRSHPGEKTILDALVPARDALQAAACAGLPFPDAVGRAAAAADAGAQATVAMLATKGRASYLGERSVGHLDPGAASSALFVRAMADVARFR
jgi:dihydroxyacetone kinase-like protein